MSDELPDLPATPDGWAVASVRSLVTTLQYGISTKADAGKTGVPIVRMGNIQKGELDLSDLKYVPRSKELAAVRLARGDVLFNRTNSPDLVGKSAVVDVDGEMVFASYLIRLVTRGDAIDPKYLCLWINSAWGREWAARVKTDGVSQSNINGTKLGDMPVPVAPLPEQRRIVDRVEMLLEEVNRAKGRLDRVLFVLRRFRQAVLAAACSGALTREWRDEHPGLAPPSAMRPHAAGQSRRGRLWGAGEVPELTDEERTAIPDSWTWMKVGELGENPEDAVQIGPMSMKSSDFTESGVTVLNVGCVQPGRVDTVKCDYLPPAKADEFERYRVLANDVLFTRSGTVGRCAVAGPEHEGAVITFHLLRVRPDQRRCSSMYLWAAFQGAPSIRRQTGEGQIGSTRGGFNTRLLASLDVPLPPRQEQDEIIRIVKQYFLLAETIERRLRVATERAERLPQSILAKAFSGELVPTEAELAQTEGRSYETAAQLLMRVTTSAGSKSRSGAQRRRTSKTARAGSSAT